MEIWVEARLSNSLAPERRQSVRAQIDAAQLVNYLPAALIDELGLRSAGSMPTGFDGGGDPRPVYGPITLELMGRVTVTDAVVAAPGMPAVLGVVTLERLGLELDPAGQQPIPRRA